MTLLGPDDHAPLGRSSVLDIYGREPRAPELGIGPGPFHPCPTKFCVVRGCDAAMDLVLSDQDYPSSDPEHLLDWPYMYRRWVCRRDKTHFVNVSADEWAAVRQFAGERAAEVESENREPASWSVVAWLVVLVPIVVLLIPVLLIRSAIGRFRRRRPPSPAHLPQRSAEASDDMIAEGMQSKSCTTPGCGGRMRFHTRQEVATAEHTLEWNWRATWTCERNPAHIEIASPEDELAVTRRRRGQVTT